MPKTTPVLVLAAVLTSAYGCSAEGPVDAPDDDPEGVDPDAVVLPTGPPPEMERGPAVSPSGADAGSGEAAGDRPSTDSGTPSSGSDAGGAPQGPPPDDAGASPGPGEDAGMGNEPMPAEDGPLNMSPVTFGPNVKINDDDGSGQQTEVVMAARPDGLILAGWIDNRRRPSRCGYSVSQDGGETWGANFFASTQGGRGAFAGDPAVAIDDAGNLYAACQDYASGGLGTNYILFAHSKDDGESWSDFTRVNQSLDKPWLGAAQDGTVLLSWLGRPGGVKRSTDHGETWSEPISLGYINHGTTLSIGNTGIVHMAYNTGETTVSYRRSEDYGVSFAPERDLSSQGRPCRSPCAPRSHPIVGGDTDPTGQVVAITWASRQDHPDAEGDDDVWVMVSYDAGETFRGPIRVNDNLNESRQFQPWVAVDRYGAVHVVWTDLRDNGQNATYYARMLDFDAGFEPNVEVTDGTGRPASFLGDYKGIDIQGRDVVVTWQDTRNDSGDIYFARAVDAAAAGGPLMP